MQILIIFQKVFSIMSCVKQSIHIIKSFWFPHSWYFIYWILFSFKFWGYIELRIRNTINSRIEWIISRCIFEWNFNFDYPIRNIDCILPHTIRNCLIISIFALLWPHGLKHQPFIFLSFSRRCLKSKCINYSFKFEAFIYIVIP